MSPARGSWSPDWVKTELEDLLENLHRLGEHLPEPHREIGGRRLTRLACDVGWFLNG